MSSLFYNAIIIAGIVIASFLILKFLWKKEASREIEQILSQLNEAKNNLKNYSSELNNLLGMMSSFQKLKVTQNQLQAKEVPELAVSNALKILGAKRGSMFLLNNETNKLELKVAIGFDPKKGEEALIPVDKEILKEAKQEDSTIVFDENLTVLTEDCDAAGQNSFLSAPLKIQGRVIGIIHVGNRILPGQFSPEDLKVLNTLAQQTAMVLDNLNLYNNLQQVYFGVIKSLTMAVDAKDHYTFGHSQRVTKYVLSMADEMNLNPEIKKLAETAAVIHDIGKIGVKEEILLKKGRLSDEEFDEIKKHPAIGRDIIKPMEFLSALAPIIYYHHQHYDGGGYPERLKGDQIPLLARMLTIADSFDAMVSERPYRRALPEEVAINELKRCAGTQFDPDLVTVFIKILRKNHPQI